MFAFRCFLVAAILTTLFVDLGSCQKPSGPTITGDPEALMILNRAIAAGGGVEAIRAIDDFEASGDITYYRAGREIKGSTKIKARGLSQVRMDSQLEDGVHSIVLSRGEGRIIEPTSTHTISQVNGPAVGLLIFYLPNLLAALGERLATVSSAGTEEFEGRSVYRIQIVQGLPQRFQHDEKLRTLKTSEVLIDADTFMILALRHIYLSNGSTARSHMREVQFSDFRTVQGLRVPFSITEKALDQRTWTIQIRDIQFNTGIQDSIFTR
jgi:hypothetical protein